MDRQARRQVRVTKEHKTEVQRLLKLMGIPFHDVSMLLCQLQIDNPPDLLNVPLKSTQAPSEAEAQCAEFCRGGLVYGTGSEDMDTLTFNSPIILRHLTFSEARKMPIDVIKLDLALEGLGLTMDQVGCVRFPTNDRRPLSPHTHHQPSSSPSGPLFHQFIDFCILCGCDYLEPLKGVGAKTAYKLIKENGDLGAAIEAIKDKDAKAKKDKQTIPDDWPWEEARELFKHPDVTPCSEVDVSWVGPRCCPSLVEHDYVRSAS